MHRLRFTVAAAVLLAAATAGAEQQRYRIDPARSRVSVHVSRAGALSSFLHDHDLVATRFGGELSYDVADPERLSLHVTVAADSLREPAGAPISADDARTVEAQVRGPKVLDAARHPRIDFAAWRFELGDRTAVAGGSIRGTLVGLVTLHGVTRPLRIPVTAVVAADHVRARGAVDLKQSDFGIKPYRKAWGSIAVEDVVRVQFAVEAVPQ